MLKFADMSKDRVLQVLKTDEQGLSESEVKVRREKYGDNQLKKGKKTSPIGLLDRKSTRLNSSHVTGVQTCALPISSPR